MRLRFKPFALILTFGIFTTSCVDYSSQGVFNAIASDNVDQLKKIEEKVDIDTCRNKDALNPLLYALSEGSEKCAFYIISNSKDLSYKDSDENNALLYALSYDYLSQNSLVDSLLQKGQDPNQEHPTKGFSMFEVATEKNDSALLQIFLKHGTNINLKSSLNSTPLYYAIALEKNNAARYLINKGANLYVESSYGNNALEIAINNNNYQMFVELLEKQQMNTNEKIKDKAISHSNTKFIAYLLDNKKISKQDIRDALFLAENTKVLKKLLNEVDDINYISNKYGINILHYACINGDTTMIKYLITQHADVNKVCSKKGYSPLMYAATCYDNSMSSMTKLGVGFSKPAKIELCMSETKNKETSLASVQLLVEAGANANFLSKEKNSAYKIAESSKNKAVADYLSKLNK